VPPTDKKIIPISTSIKSGTQQVPGTRTQITIPTLISQLSKHNWRGWAHCSFANQAYIIKRVIHHRSRLGISTASSSSIPIIYSSSFLPPISTSKRSARDHTLPRARGIRRRAAAFSAGRGAVPGPTGRGGRRGGRALGAVPHAALGDRVRAAGRRGLRRQGDPVAAAHPAPPAARPADQALLPMYAPSTKALLPPLALSSCVGD
jgi:hypothetical protein